MKKQGNTIKTKGRPWQFFVVAVLIFAFAFTAFFGVSTKYGDTEKIWIKGASDIRFGIDIRGGVDVTFMPADGYDATDEQMDAAKSVVEQRLVNLNITDNEVYTDYNKDRIIVRFPWKEGETEFNPEAAIQEIGATAHLTFREGHETDADGKPSGVTAENIILEGSDVKEAQAAVDTNRDSRTYGQYYVSLSLNESGRTKFAEATTRLAGENGTISIWMDDVMLSAPKVNEAITTGECVITGDFTSEEATQLAARIQAGALPFALQVSSFSSMPPTLGAQALDAMLLAGIIAFVVISLLMIVIFRLPGVVAVISLAGQVGLCMAAISGFFPFLNSYTMTLPGLAGIVLSIGMGVDANVISASRIREELRNGKTLDGALKLGFSESFWAIFDGNITTLIVAVMLMGVFGPSNILSIIFGESTTGAIFSFGFTLLVGIIGNFIMGMTATRLMTLSLAGFKGLHKKWLFGGARGDE